MSRAAWWHCFSGIAGDMALASLVDAGADLTQIIAGLRLLPVEGWHLEAGTVRRAGLVGTHLRVEVTEVGPERDWASLRQLLTSGEGLPPRALQRALQVFAALARAEGKLHGTPPEQVHFHEVGALDAIIDVVGTCLALELLDVASVYASPVAVGLGTIQAAHGVLPNPAPAVLELLAGAPLRGTHQELELTTPTGAAILAALAESFGPMPAMKVERTGYGAGTRDLPGTPNLLQVVIGELAEPGLGRPASALENAHWQGNAVAQELVVLEANIDDATGEILGHTVGALLGEGAFDAWLVPVVGKKGRPAHVLSVLASPATAPALAETLARQTGALGWRAHPVTRWALDRRVVQVEVEGQPVRVKWGPYRAKAEHDDCAAVATVVGLPVAEVARRAEQAAADAVAPIA